MIFKNGKYGKYKNDRNDENKEGEMITWRPKYKNGEEVIVYTDPIERKRKEGIANIVEPHEVCDHYKVRFLGEETIYIREIL